MRRPLRRPVRTAALVAATSLGLAPALAPPAGAAAPQALLKPPLSIDADDRDIPEPAARAASEIFGVLHNSWLRRLDPGDWALRRARRPALNVNAWDEVPDSSWFSNRIGMAPITPGELLDGPRGADPAPGTWRVQNVKTEGYTPGLQILDAAGRRYFLKFDLPDAPERNSAAEMIGSLIMHAAGYNVPSYSIVHFRGEDLEVGEGAVFEDELGRQRPMLPEDVTEALSLLAPRSDGSYRGIASLFLSGSIKGPFSYTGTRRDDPNDIIPHELRREIRGLRVIASWFNHVDVKENNTLDTYVSEEGRGFLRHYFIDYGSSMGSGDFVNGPCRVGFEHIFDGAATALALVTLGAWSRPWEDRCEIPYPEVGRFEGELFRPPGWKPNYPNLAFDEMDASDAYWGAKIVTAFTDEHVRVLAAAGRYSRAEVSRYVESTLRARRDKIGRYWFGAVTPLEGFEVETSSGAWTLRFRDLAVERGYALAESRSYRFEIRDALRLRPIEEGVSQQPGHVRIRPLGDIPAAPSDRWGRRPLAVVAVRALSRDGTAAPPVRVVIGYQGTDAEPRVLGWAHAPR
jgi:hypothetical protein